MADAPTIVSLIEANLALILAAIACIWILFHVLRERNILFKKDKPNVIGDIFKGGW